MPDTPRDRDTGVPLVAAHSAPATRLADLEMDTDLAHTMASLVGEVPRWDELAGEGIDLRRRVLLYGPPGCGKTSVARALAGELNRPLVVARMDSLISSYLGQTAANLAAVFDYAEVVQGVVLLDEFDSLGQARSVDGDAGELRRVVNMVLQLIENYAGRSILVAATNYPVLLDAALWRRFDIVAQVAPPDLDQMLALLTAALPAIERDFLREHVAPRLDGLSYAAGAFVANEARRTAVLGRRAMTSQDVTDAVDLALARPWGVEHDPRLEATDADDTTTWANAVDRVAGVPR